MLLPLQLDMLLGPTTAISDTTTPGARIIVVALDDRSIEIGRDNRAIIVPEDNRTLVIRQE